MRKNALLKLSSSPNQSGQAILDCGVASYWGPLPTIENRGYLDKRQPGG